LILSTEKVYESTRRALAEFGIIEPPADDQTLAQCTVLLAFPSRVKEELLAKMKSLRAIQIESAGVDGLNFSAIPRGVKIYSNAGGFTGPVAEQAWALVLGMAKGINVPNKKVPPRLVKGKTLLVLGCGSIGSEVARIGKSAFSMAAIGVSRSFSSPELFDEKRSLNELADVMPRADVMVNALPLNRFTRGVLSYDILALGKPELILVNVGRGDTVDEAAITRLLKERPQTRYATDVFWRKGAGHHEEFESPLWKLENFGGTLHSTVWEKEDAIAEAQLMAAENIRRFLLTGDTLNRVDVTDYVA
jgi:phosphoglycerate dehydrogenase-like enzyme